LLSGAPTAPAASSSGSSGVGATSAATEQQSHFLDCELTVWLDQNDMPLPAGSVASHIPRDKKQGRMRFLMRVDGALLAQAPSPLVSLHKSLTSSSNTNSGGRQVASDTSGGTATAATTAAAAGTTGNGGVDSASPPAFATAGATAGSTGGVLVGAGAADEGTMMMSSLASHAP
jgi:hypothetical protein